MEERSGKVRAEDRLLVKSRIFVGVSLDYEKRTALDMFMSPDGSSLCIYIK